MREIKFRAWNDKKKIMVYDNEDKSSDYWDGVELSQIRMVNAQFTNNEHYNWMQYTGFLDKNGTMIYEGDILNYRTRYTKKPPPQAVDFRNGAFYIGGEKIGYLLGDEDIRETEVIGNIYENPELIT